VQLEDLILISVDGSVVEISDVFGRQRPDRAGNRGTEAVRNEAGTDTRAEDEDRLASLPAPST
jgi:hypothetical protein